MPASRSALEPDPLVRWLAAGTLLFTVLVVLGGSVVRATESGAGCGEQWPRCDGHILPWSAEGATLVELTHRAMTGVLGVLMLGLVAAVLARTRPGAPIRRSMAWAAGFFAAEVLIGASLVVFGWVGDDASVGRMAAVTVHLVNTFLLLGALTLVAWLAAGQPPPRVDTRRATDRLVLLGAGVLLVVAASGALNALADTLFPADEPTSGHVLADLRVLHPLVAVAGGLAVWLIARAPALDAGDGAARWRRAVGAVIVSQFALGVLNIALLTPVETQVLHLLLADTLWVVWIAFGARVVTALGAAAPTVAAVP